MRQSYRGTGEISGLAVFSALTPLAIMFESDFVQLNLFMVVIALYILQPLFPHLLKETLFK